MTAREVDVLDQMIVACLKFVWLKAPRPEGTEPAGAAVDDMDIVAHHPMGKLMRSARDWSRLSFRERDVLEQMLQAAVDYLEVMLN